MDALLWAILLLVGGLGLLILEVFVPSGGILGLLAALCVAAAIVVGFTIGLRQGITVSATAAVLVPLVLALAVRVWPHTPIGRLMLLSRPEDPDAILPDSVAYRGLRQLIGKTGVSVSTMLPSGLVEIEGERYDAVGEGEAIEPGKPIRVVDVRTNRIVVRLAEGEHVSPADAQPDSLADVDPLSRPIDDLGIEGLDEPLE